eukprot:scaffold64758_cov31-Tisochrysis_lutea.AAC.2
MAWGVAITHGAGPNEALLHRYTLLLPHSGPGDTPTCLPNPSISKAVRALRNVSVVLELSLCTTTRMSAAGSLPKATSAGFSAAMRSSSHLVITERKTSASTPRDRTSGGSEDVAFGKW